MLNTQYQRQEISKKTEDKNDGKKKQIAELPNYSRQIVELLGKQNKIQTNLPIIYRNCKIKN